MTFDAVSYPPSTGAMTAAMRAHAKLALELRVAVVRDGRIVDERRVPRNEAVTVGGERATVVTGGKTRTLFDGGARAETGFALVGGGIAGRVQQAGGAQDVAALPDGASLPLAVGARGRVVVDGTTVLFDFVPARSRTRPALPAAVKKSVLGDVDWPFTSWVTGAMLACFALVAVSQADDPPIASDIDASLAAYAHMVIEPPTPPTPLPAAVVTHDGPSTPSPAPSHATPGPTPGDTHRPSRPANHDPQPTLTPDQIAEIAQQAQLLVVGSLDGSHGAVHDLLANGAPTISQRDVMDQVHGATIASNGDQVLRTRPGDSGSGETHDLGTLVQHVATNGVDEGRGPTETQVTTIVRVPICDGDCGPMPPAPPADLAQRVQRAVRARIPMIRACYEHHLINAPTAAGKVVESFTLESYGGVSHVQAESNTADDGTEQCVRNGLATLRVEMHDGDESNDFVFPFVFAPQN